MMGMTERLSRLRGSLPAEEPGARGLERVARNPACQRLRALTMLGVTPATAMRIVYSQPDREGQSPFALGAGSGFERKVFENGAARLVELYRKAGRLSTAECKVVVVPELAPVGKTSTMPRRRAETERLFRLKARLDPRAPNIIVKARMSVMLLGVPHDIEPDVLVAADSEVFYRPVEIKSYPDRAGKTNAADIRSACRQAAVAVIGLRQAVEKLHLGDPRQLVPPAADLVLRTPGSYWPKLWPMTLEGEVDSLQRALDEAPRNLEELEMLIEAIEPGASLDDADVLDAVPANYVESCREHCALAPKCKQEAVACGDPVLIGSQAREELAAAGSLGRAVDLMHGRTKPGTTEEQLLQIRLQEALSEYRKAAGHGR
jgi:hypothetical protein